jgi:hypothetical protein
VLFEPDSAETILYDVKIVDFSTFEASFQHGCLLEAIRSHCFVTGIIGRLDLAAEIATRSSTLPCFLWCRVFLKSLYSLEVFRSLEPYGSMDVNEANERLVS